MYHFDILLLCELFMIGILYVLFFSAFFLKINPCRFLLTLQFPGHVGTHFIPFLLKLCIYELRQWPEKYKSLKKIYIY